jgi:transcriptional regulator with AAA-type ATPase domain/pSer/pThr/pTyr-binding forkhead associated (FHA) protein
MAELVFLRRGEEVLRVSLDKERVVVGSGEQCDVFLPDPEVSRQQIALRHDGAGWAAEDLSGKGTVVGGKKISHAALKDGVDITLGQWQAVFRSDAGRDASAEVTARETLTAVVPKDPAPRQLPMQVRVRQGHRENLVTLKSEVFTVGKDAQNDLVLNDRYISGRHLKVTRKENAFLCADQGSTNGTWLGNARVYEVDLPVFTVLRLGDVELCFEPAISGLKIEASYLGLIGQDAAMRQLAELIERVAPSMAAVAIFGESGTGKELVARAVHQRSPRNEKLFVPVNCAAISRELIESELFGHEKGAFTGATNMRKGAFEEADGGTLFLDEIGELSLDPQAKLLRALESGEIKRVGASRPMNVDVRIVAATNRDLLRQAAEGRFREDLYYRLCVFPLTLPPLRSRRGDVEALAEHFLKQFSPKGQLVKLSPEALNKLQNHGWPGNVRELRNVVHRALLMRKAAAITAEDISFDVASAKDLGLRLPDFPAGTTLDQMMQTAERLVIEHALRRYDHNRERVARELGVARSTLFKRLKDWGLTSGGDD